MYGTDQELIMGVSDKGVKRISKSEHGRQWFEDLVIGARWLLSQPVFRFALSVAALSSAATMGALLAIGLPVFPVVDAGQLFVQLTSYVTLALLLTSAIGAMWRVFASQSEPIDEGLSFVLVAIKRRLKIKNSYQSLRKFAKGALQPDYHARTMKIFTAATAVIVVTVIALLALRPPVWLRNLVGLESFVGALLLLSTVALLITFVTTFNLPEKRRATSRFLRSLKTYAFTGLQLALLALAFTSGTLWVEYLRDVAPTVTIRFTKPELPTQTVRLAVAARDGYLVFRRGERTARFIPTNAIEEIIFTSSQTTIP